MIEIRLNREEFLAWIANPSRYERVPFPTSNVRGDISLVWLQDVIRGDPVVAVPASDLREFLAFVTTYVATYVPFTAFFRVVPREMLAAVPAVTSGIDSGRSIAAIGAIICDAAAQIVTPAERKVADVSIQACLASPGASLLAAAAIGYDVSLGRATLDRWFTTRSELGSLPPASRRSLSFWSVVLPIIFAQSDMGDELTRFVESVIRGEGVAPDMSLASLLGPLAPGLGEILRGNRERRVQVLENLAVDLRSSGLASDEREMVVGYVLAQVAEGSLSYLPLASRVSGDASTSMLWYGFFSGLNQNNDILVAGENLGRRLARNFSREGESLPELVSDLSYEHFLLLRNERTLSIRTNHQAVADVELIPGVRGLFRLPRTERSQGTGEVNAALVGRLKRLVDQMSLTLREAERGTPNGDLFADGSKELPAADRSARSSNKKRQAR